MFDNVTRLEIIQEDVGRLMVKYNIKIETFLQDEGKTLKIYIKEAPKKDLDIENIFK